MVRTWNITVGRAARDLETLAEAKQKDTELCRELTRLAGDLAYVYNDLEDTVGRL